MSVSPSSLHPSSGGDQPSCWMRALLLPDDLSAEKICFPLSQTPLFVLSWYYIETTANCLLPESSEVVIFFKLGFFFLLSFCVEHSAILLPIIKGINNLYNPLRCPKSNACWSFCLPLSPPTMVSWVCEASPNESLTSLSSFHYWENQVVLAGRGVRGEGADIRLWNKQSDRQRGGTTTFFTCIMNRTHPHREQELLHDFSRV